jgi:hypothetical protein
MNDINLLIMTKKEGGLRSIRRIKFVKKTTSPTQNM